MLRKLMKYDLKYYLRIMFPLWVVLIIYGIIHGINTMSSEIYNQISVKEEAIVVVLSIYFIFWVNAILVIQRFSVRSSSVLQQFTNFSNSRIFRL